MRIKNKVAFIFLTSLPVLAFTFKFSVLDRHGGFGSDWAYFAQIYEAARLSILKYHQFPWWNSWSLGGVPLYANPQFGLFSIPMLFVLLFGTVVGLHLSVMVYILLGFWGMYLLLNRLKASSRYIAILLAYIWTFSGFIAAHMAIGHLTFSAYLISPWFFLTLLNIRKKRGWVWFGLVTTFIVVQSPHNIAVDVLTIGIAVAIFQVTRLFFLREKSILQIIKPYILSLVIIVPLVSFKLLFVLQYLHEYPRITPLDATVPASLLIAALIFRNFQGVSNALGSVYGWWEYADYISIITFALFCYMFVSKLLRKKKLDIIDWTIVISIAVVFLLSLGPIFYLSPYTLIHTLPIFGEMRVPSRWIGWVSFGVILFLARLPKKPIIYVLLLLAALDVFFANYGILNAYQSHYTPPKSYSRVIEQYSYYGNRSPISLLYETQSNIGQVYGYEPILGFGGNYDPSLYSKLTNRCGINQGCSFVETGNATVEFWSPLKIILIRNSSGPIILDMNPGKNWSVNGKRVFSNYRVLELERYFVINNSSPKIVITYSSAL